MSNSFIDTLFSVFKNDEVVIDSKRILLSSNVPAPKEIPSKKYVSSTESYGVSLVHPVKSAVIEFIN